jgi:mono/diheme cytochrome c family protein
VYYDLLVGNGLSTHRTLLRHTFGGYAGLIPLMSMVWRRRTGLPWLLAMMLLFGACDKHTGHAGVSRFRAGRVPADRQRPGDPQAGYEDLLNRPVVSCGLPYSAYKAGAGRPDPTLLQPGRRGRNAEMPYMLTAYRSGQGQEWVSSNCLTCHAARFNGEFVMGLGNEFLDFTADPLAEAVRWGAYLRGEAAIREWRSWARRVDTVAPYMTTDTVGVNPGDTLVLAVLAHRDPKTLAWSDKPLIEPPRHKPLPVSVPPWWSLRKKHALFYNAEGRGDHARLMAIAAASCTDSLEQAAAIDAWFPDLLAYITSLQPPRYPYPIDRDLADRGADLFAAACAACHGSYGEGARYPNRVIALRDIGTDPALATAAYKDSDRFIRWLERSFYGELARVVPSLGYIAPPLDGVWATAPYLHNGSVPTIRGLLDSKTRPKFWRFQGIPPAFDQQGLGWRCSAVPYGKAGALSWDERDRLYDTTLPGYSNQGHTYGDGLSALERSAILEYLKTL